MSEATRLPKFYLAPLPPMYDAHVRIGGDRTASSGFSLFEINDAEVHAWGIVGRAALLSEPWRGRLVPFRRSRLIMSARQLDRGVALPFKTFERRIIFFSWNSSCKRRPLPSASMS